MIGPRVAAEVLAAQLHLQHLLGAVPVGDEAHNQARTVAHETTPRHRGATFRRSHVSVGLCHVQTPGYPAVTVSLRPLLLLSLVATAAHAADDVPLPLTLLDVPEVFATPQHAPTWEQSLDLTGDLYRAAHLGIHAGFTSLSKAWWSVLLEELATAAFDLAMMTAPLPLTEGWMHEEGHRAAMGVRGVTSRQVFDNAFYAPDQRCDPGSVCGMTDEQIAGVKDRRAADWVRVQEAGMESELELMHRLERDAFFAEQPRALNIPSAVMLLASVELYRNACAEGQFSDAGVTAESSHQLQRDFTGPDCTGWVWDLFRPGTPYADRGLHPNGDGVRRVRLTSDLTAEERSYLIRMRNLGLLNFVDPALFAFPRVDVTLPDGRTLGLTASLQHDLTASGDAFALSAMAQLDQLNLYGALRLYRNQALTLPGLTVAVRRFPVRVGPVTVLTSALVDLWLQPQEFSFTTKNVMPGGALEVQGAVKLAGPLEAFVALRAKSAGWRPADPWLDAAFSGRVGVNLLLPVL
jgi:hypothetical protein